MSVTSVLAPIGGRAVDLAEVPDPVFSQGLVGWGAAVDPIAAPAEALAPVGGRLIKLIPHAYIVMTPAGFGVLVHLGLDTVRLDGAGFAALATEGDEVAAGTPIIGYDVPAVSAAGFNPIAVTVVMDEREPERVAVSESVRAGAEIAAGAPLFGFRSERR